MYRITYTYLPPAVYPERAFLEAAYNTAIANIETLASETQVFLRHQIDCTLEYFLNANNYAVLRDQLITA